MKKLTLDDLHDMRNHSNKFHAIKTLRDGRSEVFGLGDAKTIVEALQGSRMHTGTTVSAIKCLVDYIERTTAEDEQDRVESRGAPVPTCVPVPGGCDGDHELRVLSQVFKLLDGLNRTDSDAAQRVIRYCSDRLDF